MTNLDANIYKMMAYLLEKNCKYLKETLTDSSCSSTSNCSNCEFRNIESCHDWLNREEKEPELLKNGDGLKTGDYIMVKYYKADTWKKRHFLCYYNGWFLTAESMTDAIVYNSHKNYSIARLPMEDE